MNDKGMTQAEAAIASIAGTIAAGLLMQTSDDIANARIAVAFAREIMAEVKRTSAEILEDEKRAAAKKAAEDEYTNELVARLTHQVAQQAEELARLIHACKGLEKTSNG